MLRHLRILDATYRKDDSLSYSDFQRKFFSSGKVPGVLSNEKRSNWCIISDKKFENSEDGADTLSLGDRTLDNMDRRISQSNRPRQQILDNSSDSKLTPDPVFDYSQSTNVTTLIGQTAYFVCRVRHLGDKTHFAQFAISSGLVTELGLGLRPRKANLETAKPFLEQKPVLVSWVRHRDIHILTAGTYTYTSDQRFQALHQKTPNSNSEWSEWTLCIKWAQERDQGVYECQISTIPAKSYKFQLNVVVPTATILGGPEMYVGAGSTINLTCAIHFSSEPPAYIFWYYNGNVLSYDSPRGGVSVITEKGGDVTTSWLLIQAAQPSDSGEYSCKPSNANTASIKVHVLHGERPEAMQTGTAGPILSSSCLLVSLIILYISSL
ncbi:cell adhesion molecule 2-like [Vespula squamosa]|uniref:Cell adhesion molecule 2-like n=1 Tax=Vespula squamosa TaxID=30214 RepID=A0ABD2BGX4_VESSQ